MTLSIDGMTEEDREDIVSRYIRIGQEQSADEDEEQPAPKRKRGRPPGARNKPKPSDYAPTGDSIELPTLTSPPLTTRDQREISKRLAGILTGVTGVASVVKPYFQMTDEEAEAIAIPLSTYLIRTESTSATARRLLDEYDVAAFVIALAAYVVRVYLDFQRERSQSRVDREQQRVVEQESREIIQQSGLQTQEGEERPFNREFVSVSQGGWTPSPL